MNKFVRSSKYRHVYAKAPHRDDVWDGISLTKNAWDSNWMAASSKYIAVAWATGGGGSVGILDAEKPGKLEPTKVPQVSGHKGAILNLQFDPFNPCVLATCSEDATVKIWKLPNDGLEAGAHINDAAQTLVGHKRKVGVLAFHPVAEDLIASGAQDYDVNIWDIETGAKKLTIPGHTAIIQSLDWNYDGSLLCSNAKDKKVRVLDPRAQEVVYEHAGHQGVKGGRALWLGKHQKFLSVGFGTGASREYCIWDQKKADKPVLKQTLDNSSGVIMPFYDEDADLVFFAGKGDGMIRYYEVEPNNRDGEGNEKKECMYPITAFSSNESTAAACALPRRNCKINENEIIRLYKATGSKVQPLRFTVPRKSDLFADDIYPDCRGDEPNITKEDWFEGQNATPKLISLEDGFVAREPKEKNLQKVDTSVKELSGKQMKERITELEKKVAFLEAEMVKKDAKIKELEGN